MAWSLMWWTTSKGELSSLYGIIHNKYGTAPELISFLGKCYHWNVSFNRLVGVRIGSLSWIYFILVCGKGRWWKLGWKTSSQGVFVVWSCYKVLLSPSQLSFPWKTVWKPKVPTSVFSYGWRHWVIFQLMIIYGNVILLLFIAVVFVRGLGRPVITYLYTGL